mmetsp:Transcript_79895/g.125987  ORF Transcript_79895/g.125987 Transcript_79895/m.125987 type:complete len:98 (-) Transcript_79895:21-314(-)
MGSLLRASEVWHTSCNCSRGSILGALFWQTAQWFHCGLSRCNSLRITSPIANILTTSYMFLTFAKMFEAQVVPCVDGNFAYLERRDKCLSDARDVVS